jgi:hypothetical protein
MNTKQLFPVSPNKLLLCLLLWGLMLPAANAAMDSASVCEISDMASLNDCVRNQTQFDQFEFTADVSCQGEDCCGWDGRGLMNLSRSKDGKTVLGNGHTLTRHAMQRQCPAIIINNVSNVSLQNLNLDEDAEAAPCVPDDHCKATVHVQNSKNVSLIRVNIYNGKAYVVRVWGVDGFVFGSSSVSNAGIIGLCVEHMKFTPSRHVLISNSVFAVARANGVAITGVDGEAVGDNQIVNNVFSGNHYHGLWMDGSGKVPTTGGQLYIPYANNLTVSDNLIADGRCQNCSNPAVWGMELGAPNEGSTLTNVVIARNFVYNSLGYAFLKNDGADLNNSVVITQNKAFGVPEMANFSEAAFNDTNLVINPSRNLKTAPLTAFTEADKSAARLLARPNQAFARAVAAVPSDPAGPGISLNLFGDVNPSLNYEGSSENTIYQLKRRKHLESQWPLSHFKVIDRFKLSAFPRSGSSPGPIYRCLIVGKKLKDFVSSAKDCEGQVMLSIYGYSYQPSYPGALPFYRCRKGNDYYLSWDQSCGGDAADGHVGYALAE